MARARAIGRGPLAPASCTRVCTGRWSTTAAHATEGAPGCQTHPAGGGECSTGGGAVYAPSAAARGRRRISADEHEGGASSSPFGPAGRSGTSANELPVFIAVRAKPVARIVAPLVREAHSDASAIERPQLL